MDQQKTINITGERLTLGHSSKRNQEDHVARYAYASKYVKDSLVLDVACGTGYGVEQLCKAGAKKVYGVDIDKESILFAQENHKHSNANYICGTASRLDFEDNTFDVIVTFETIEHLQNEERKAYLGELFRVLKPQGQVILSTPNKLITSPWSEKPLNPYHELEFYREGLEHELVDAGFAITWWGGQRFVRKIFTKRFTYLIVRAFEKIIRQSSGTYEIANGPQVLSLQRGSEPRYFVVRLEKYEK